MCTSPKLTMKWLCSSIVNVFKFNKKLSENNQLTAPQLIATLVMYIERRETTNCP